MGRQIHVNGEYMEVWCVQSARHVTCIYQSQNQVLGMSVSYLIFGTFFVVSVEACWVTKLIIIC